MNLNVENTFVPKLRLTWTMLGLLAIVTMVAAWWRWLGNPTLLKHDELSRQLLAVQILQDAEANILRRHDQLQVELVDWTERHELLISRTQAHENEGQFLKWVNEQANLHSLTIRDYRPGSRQVQGDFESRSVQLTAYGSYAAICNFLSQVRTGPRMLRINHLELLPRDKSGQTYSCNIQMLLFSQISLPSSQPVRVAHATAI